MSSLPLPFTLFCNTKMIPSLAFQWLQSPTCWGILFRFQSSHVSLGHISCLPSQFVEHLGFLSTSGTYSVQAVLLPSSTKHHCKEYLSQVWCHNYCETNTTGICILENCIKLKWQSNSILTARQSEENYVSSSKCKESLGCMHNIRCQSEHLTTIVFTYILSWAVARDRSLLCVNTKDSRSCLSRYKCYAIRIACNVKRCCAL